MAKSKYPSDQPANKKAASYHHWTGGRTNNPEITRPGKTRKDRMGKKKENTDV